MSYIKDLGYSNLKRYTYPWSSLFPNFHNMAPIVALILFHLLVVNVGYKDLWFWCCRSATYARQAALRQQKADPQEVPEKEVKVQSDGFSSKMEKSSLIKSIKMKAIPFEGKMPKKEENLRSTGIKDTKVEQDPPTLVQPVKKKAKVGRK